MYCSQSISSRLLLSLDTTYEAQHVAHQSLFHRVTFDVGIHRRAEVELSA